jgi:FtsP/CotA-like multicopper oxidase with cupredoxin domain
MRPPVPPPAVLATVLLALPALAGCLASPAPQAEQPAASEGRVRSFDLYVAGGTLEPVKGKPFFALGFVANPEDVLRVPGPEVRVTEGDRVRVTLHGGHHTLHWHGVSVPWGMDGVPYMTQSLGDGNFTYEFVAHETGTYWYHCHVDAPTHIDLGMFGAFIVEPRDKAQDPPFGREYTLFLHEQDVAGLNSLRAGFGLAAGDPGGLAPVVTGAPPNPAELPGYAQHVAVAGTDAAGVGVGDTTGAYAAGSVGPRDYYPESSVRYFPQYDTFMINGKVFPDTDPVKIRTGETVRVRLINAGQLLHTMHLHGHHGLVTHKDGYKLASPYYADTIVLGPGERYDVYVKGDNPGIWDFHDHGGAWGVGAYAATDHAFPGGMNTMFVYEDFQYAQLPAPTPDHAWTSGDYMAFAPRYPGVTPPDMMHHEH